MIQIILCEDERDFLAKITAEILDWKAMRGHQDVLVQSFASAEDLWEALERGLSCDLLFLDICMPDGLNGYELAQRIRETNQRMQIVFVSNSMEFWREAIRSTPFGTSQTRHAAAAL